MRKILILLFGFILSTLSVYSGEIEDDYLDIASNYCVIGDYSNAMIYLDKILTKNPDNKHILYLKHCLKHIMDNDKKTYVSSVNPSIVESMNFEKKGDLKGQINSLKNATQENNSYLAYYYIGNLHRKNKEYLKAIDFYNLAISQRSDFAQAYLALAITMYEMGNYKIAIDTINKYLSFSPNDDFAYAIKSKTEFELGLLESAKADIEKAIFINKSAEYLFDKAKILYKLEKYSDSKNLFISLLKEIQTSKIYEYIGLCDIELNNYSSALLNIEKAMLLSNNDKYLENKYKEIKENLESK